MVIWLVFFAFFFFIMCLICCKGKEFFIDCCLIVSLSKLFGIFLVSCLVCSVVDGGLWIIGWLNFFMVVFESYFMVFWKNLVKVFVVFLEGKSL